MKKLTIIYSLLSFFYYFNFFWLIQNVYFVNKGISFKELSILLSVWSISVILFEIPSGILADKFSRKWIVVISKIGFLLGIATFIFTPTFWGFIVGMIFWGIHESFVSGSLDALIYDELKSKHHENQYEKILSKATLSREFGLGVGVLISGFISDININYNFVGSLILASIGVIISLMLPNPKNFAEDEESNYLKFFSSSLKIILKDVSLIKLTFFFMFAVMSYEIVDEYFVISLQTLGFNYSWIGILAVIEMLFFAIGVWAANKFSKTRLNYIYIIIAFFMMIFTASLVTKNIIIVLVSLMFLRALKANAEITGNNDWQNRIRSKDRATTISIRSFISNIYFVPLSFIFGTLADKVGVFSAYYLVAAVSGLYIITELYLYIRKNYIIVSS